MINIKKLLAALLGATSLSAYAAFDTSVTIINYPSSPVIIGQSVNISAQVVNDSSSTNAASNVVVSLSGMKGFNITGFTTLSGVINCSYDNGFGSGSCTITSLAAGSSVTVSATLTAVTPGAYQITAAVTPGGTVNTNDSVSMQVKINSAPTVVIAAPGDESIFASGSSLLLSASATDTEDGDISSQLNWFSNVSGFLGTGASINASLSDGRHTIRAISRDSVGTTGVQEVQVVVGGITQDTPTIRTIAGTGIVGFSGDGGSAKLAKFSGIGGATQTPNGNIYVIDSGNKVIRKIDTAGVITTLLSGQLYANLTAITSDIAGNLYWANDDSDCIKKMTPNGTITTAAGCGGMTPREGIFATDAYFSGVSDIAVNNLGELFIVVPNKNQIYKVGADNVIHIAAGNGVNSYYPTFGNLASNTPIAYPTYIALDAQGRLYISQPATSEIGSRILKVDEFGILSLYAGAAGGGYSGDFGSALNAQLGSVGDLFLNQAGELLFFESTSSRVHKIDANGMLTTVFGNGSTQVSGDGGFAAEAGLGAYVILAAGGNNDILVVGQNRIRKIFFSPYSVDLSVKATGAVLIDSGSSASVSFAVSNLLSDPVENTLLVFDAANIIPNSVTGADYCAIVDVSYRCRINSLAANGSKTISAQVNTNGSGPRKISAGVGSYFVETTPANNQVQYSYVLNTKPSVTIIAPQGGATFIETDTITLSATAFDNEDGSLDSAVKWTSSLSGNLGQGANLNVQLAVGTHTLTATVTDSSGAQSKQQISVVVKAANKPPTITFVSPTDQSTVGVDAGPITFNITATDIEDGNVAASLQLSSSIDGVFTSPARLSVGTHTITAKAADSMGLVSTKSITLNVTPHVNQAPVVTISSPVSGASFTTSQAVTLAAQATDAEDGNVSASVTWTSSINGAITSPATLSAGVHTLTASVSDKEGKIGSKTVQITVTNPQQGYCASKGTNATYEWINQVIFGGQSSTTGSNNGYYNGVSTIFNMIVGNTITASLSPGFRSGSYTEYWSIWVDLNRNGVFETNERLFSGSGSATVPASFKIPVGTSTGKTTMRVSMKYGASSQPCESFSFGEVEDYTVNIL